MTSTSLSFGRTASCLQQDMNILIYCAAFAAIAAAANATFYLNSGLNGAGIAACGGVSQPCKNIRVVLTQRVLSNQTRVTIFLHARALMYSSPCSAVSRQRSLSLVGIDISRDTPFAIINASTCTSAGVGAGRGACAGGLGRRFCAQCTLFGNSAGYVTGGDVLYSFSEGSISFRRSHIALGSSPLALSPTSPRVLVSVFARR